MRFFLFEELKNYARDYPERLDSLTAREWEKDNRNRKEDFYGSYDHHRNLCSSHPALRT